MDGQAKVSLVLEVKNRMKTAIHEAKQHLNQNVREMKNQLADFKNNANTHMSGFERTARGYLDKVGQHFNRLGDKLGQLKTKWAGHLSDLTDKIPGLGTAFAALINPVALAGAAIAVAFKGAATAMQEAARFSGVWRQLAMLNIDKTDGQRAQLKDMVLSAAYTKGFDHSATSTAFFDVQSATGKYGREVDVIVRKQGEFAQLMQADFNKWIEGSAKAMANYRFGLDKLDEFNRSAFATVKVGVTNYDQIASVMSTYAGSAASANQNFNTANKLFAIFTAKVKSVDEASTLTKSLFNDLTKETTIKAFERIGIHMYDVNGRFRQADDILMELNKKFRNLTDDRSIVALKNQFTGSEGLIAFIQAATDKTDGLKNAFDTFDNAELGLVKATKIAREDINYINEQLQNRTSVLWAQIGKDLIPIKAWLAETASSTIRWFMTPELYKRTVNGEATAKIRDKHAGLVSPENLSDREYGNAIEDAKLQRDLLYEQLNANKAYKHNVFKAFNRDRYTQYHTAAASIGEINDLIKESSAKRAQATNNPFAAETPVADPAGAEKKLPDAATAITQAAQPAKSLTVNIDSFVKGGINTQRTELQQMDENQLESWFKNMFLRVIANVDTAYQ